MPVASSMGWVDSRVTPEATSRAGAFLPPTLPPQKHPGAGSLCLDMEVAGSSWWPPPSPLTAASLAAHAVMWQGTTTTRANWLM